MLSRLSSRRAPFTTSIGGPVKCVRARNLVGVPRVPDGSPMMALNSLHSTLPSRSPTLPRILRYSTQDAYWGRTPDNDSAKAASRIGRLRDPNRPTKLTEEQNQQIRRKSRIVELYDIRNHLRAKIVSIYNVIKMAEGESIYDDYQRLGRIFNNSIRAEERALKKRIQKKYNTTASGIEIQR
jgi:hypothetical protein